MIPLIDLDKIKQGDENVFSLFFEDIYPKMMSLACRFVDDEVAKDMTQEAFIAFWERRTSLQTSNLYSYLFRSVQNNCLNYIKHNRVAEDYEYRVRVAEARIQYLNEMSDENNIIKNLESKDIKATLEAALGKLHPKCQEAFRLCYFEDLTYKEIAEIMNISHRTVEVHVQKALKQLKQDINALPLLFLLIFSQY